MMARRVLLAAAFLALVAGCVRRKEQITIMPDGAVLIAVTAVGDPRDMTEGDALPTEAAGWKVMEKREVAEKDNTETLTRCAVRRLSKGEKLPESYAEAGTPLAAVALQFPTTVTIESRNDGTYYHFTRVYRPRRAAQVQDPRDVMAESDEIKAIRGKSPEVITDEDRHTLAKARIEVEAQQAGELLDIAARAMEPPLPPDVWMIARRRMMDVYRDPEVARRGLALLFQDDAGPKSVALEQEVRQKSLAALETSLAEQNVASERVTQLLKSLDQLRREYEVTEDLGDDTFEVRVRMPGRVIAHTSNSPTRAEALGADFNDLAQKGFGDLVTIQRGFIDAGGPDATKAGFECVTWTFSGKALYDRTVVLAATSFVPR